MRAHSLPFVTAPEDQVWTVDEPIEPLILSVALGGTPPYTYALSGPDGGALPAGLEFDPASRTLSGTPVAVTAAPVPLTYRVTDDDADTDTATFTVTVTHALPALEAVTASAGTGGGVLSIADGAATLVFDFSEEVDGFADAVFTLADAGDATVTGAAVGTVTRSAQARRAARGAVDRAVHAGGGLRGHRGGLGVRHGAEHPRPLGAR